LPLGGALGVGRGDGQQENGEAGDRGFSHDE
jgi:hypothetical protein